MTSVTLIHISILTPEVSLLHLPGFVINARQNSWCIAKHARIHNYQFPASQKFGDFHEDFLL